jgi:long-subunit acyl-CoA synthetase (AMP-forming)
MGCPVLQGYGLTETTACATLNQLDEHSTGRVGPPVQGINIRLADAIRRWLMNGGLNPRIYLLNRFSNQTIPPSFPEMEFAVVFLDTMSYD